MSLLSRKGPKAGENSGIWTPFLWKNRPIFTHTERKERKLNSSQKRKKRAILTRRVEETIIYLSLGNLNFVPSNQNSLSIQNCTKNFRNGPRIKQICWDYIYSLFQLFQYFAQQGYYILWIEEYALSCMLNSHPDSLEFIDSALWRWIVPRTTWR